MAIVMLLPLSLPAFDEHPTNPPETKPARLQVWLDDVLKRDIVEAARIIGDALAATNRVALSATRRLELADMYYATAETLWTKLDQHFARASQPLTDVALAAAKATLVLASELYIAYKHLLSAQSERRFTFGATRLPVVLIHRCLHCATRVLATSYVSYAPVPARTWHDTHVIYMFSRERNLHHAALPGDASSTTPDRLYVQALLLALSNPYGFLPGQLTQVLHYLQEHSQWAKLTDVAPIHRLAKAVAIVPVGHDFPPFSANKGGNIDGSKLFLLTFDLAFQIQEQLRTLDGGGTTPPGIGTDAAARMQYLALLRRLLRQWAIPPARQFNRLPSRARVVMCAGLPAVWQYSRGAHSKVANAPTGLPTMNSCQVINHTPAGYALRQIDSAHAPLRIGDLIALRVDGRSVLQVAVLRWFRNTLRGTGLEFGCELLTDNSEAGAARAEGPEGNPFFHVVLLPDEGQDGSPPMLLVPNKTFQLEQAISLRRGTTVSTVVLTKAVEQGPGFELYEYVVVA
jgi:cyclic-di-GMP-binding protein